MPAPVPFRPLPLNMTDVRYAHGPDSLRQPGVPNGRTLELRWDASTVYPGTSRTLWIHVPSRYDPSQPAGLVVFNDGWWTFDPTGEVRGAVVLDNLVYRGDIPVTIGVFVNPGVIAGAEAAQEPQH